MQTTCDRRLPRTPPFTSTLSLARFRKQLDRVRPHLSCAALPSAGYSPRAPAQNKAACKHCTASPGTYAASASYTSPTSLPPSAGARCGSC
ncbi:hypothetical protein CesoFtcFv8_004274 [Champsocephalus esox]|uniref:Uncharacterized protein n=1 Tax=Champsocephalus esox TaxID=159716 RepID=A0AAN8CUC5_9TELE|nr:hypothetical protein CesoFtcFv8_004274 [Champsocephalus esox]